MKNSRKSQIIFFIIFALLFVGIGVTSTQNVATYILGSLGLVVVLLATMIYFLICAKKKFLAVVLDLVAIALCVPSVSNAFKVMEHTYLETADEQSLFFFSTVFNGLSISIAFLMVVFLLALISSFIPWAYFSKKATCAICGKEIGMNRFKVGKTTSGNYIWKCPDCAKKGGLLNIDYATGKVTLIDNKETETRMRCNTCGHIYCYTFADLQRNEKLAKGAVMDSLVGVGEAVGGTRLGSQVATAKADAKMNQIVDYTKCPHCNSTDVSALTKEEWEAEKAKKAQGNSVPLSSADELKKYKELLDMGVITQEEFDAKKKQLLGL